mmetsp:Transcript_14711/g.16670  ORF Transcript_14711/g.16670 Transcript_14711/m.16670 type:complete len:98 (-) Transcript_14711:225-518(-)
MSSHKLGFQKALIRIFEQGSSTLEAVTELSKTVEELEKKLEDTRETVKLLQERIKEEQEELSPEFISTFELEIERHKTPKKKRRTRSPMVASADVAK